MILGGVLAAGVLVLAQANGLPATDTRFDAVKRLYGSAAYEEALRQIAILEGQHDPDELDQYRALALIGLGRTAEADRTLEGIVRRSPGFQVDESEASPAFLARFAAVRQRVLPAALNALYTRAKTSFSVEDYEGAARQLTDLLDVLENESTWGDASLANVQRLAEGLLRLTRAELAAESRAVYSAVDEDVTPPFAVERKLPPWNPPPEYGWRSFRGVVEVVVDERGQVESAQLIASLADFYDTQLLAAAKTWQFIPAERAGKPVKYRKLVEVTMRP